MIGTASGQGAVMSLMIYQSAPNKMRSEVEVQGMKIIQTFDGEEGWMVNPMMGTDDPQPIPAQQVALMKQNDIAGHLLDYKERGIAIEYAGRDTVDNAVLHILKITPPYGVEVEYALDAETLFPVSTVMKLETDGQTTNVRMKFSDYEMVDGRMMAHRIEQDVNGMTASTMTVDTVVFNIDLDDSLFAKPGSN